MPAAGCRRQRGVSDRYTAVADGMGSLTWSRRSGLRPRCPSLVRLAFLTAKNVVVFLACRVHVLVPASMHILSCAVNGFASLHVR
jgi:hypothetical protein